MLSGVTGNPDARSSLGPVYCHGQALLGRQDPQPGARAEPGGDAAAHGGAVEERRDSRGGDGEDGLLSHGAMFALRDRLSDNSDATMVVFCRTCGRIGERRARGTGRGGVTKPLRCRRKPCHGFSCVTFGPLRDGAAASGTGGDTPSRRSTLKDSQGAGDVGTWEDDVATAAGSSEWCLSWKKTSA